MKKKTTIKSHIVSYDETTASSAVRYLMMELDDQEAKVFFNEAYNHGFATFEDHMGTRYKLVHSGGEYQLIKL